MWIDIIPYVLFMFSYTFFVPKGDKMSLGIRQSLDDFRRDFIGSAIDPELRRGRGAVTNKGGRYEARVRMAEDDGWGNMMERPAFRTETMIEKAKTIITRNDSPDLSFDRSVNPYRGCEHGCAYCFARPTHAYMGLSPAKAAIRIGLRGVCAMRG
jgi:hypothetical protein